MSSSQASKKTKLSRSPSPSRKIIPLPRTIRQELKLTCAMRGYSEMKCGSKKKLCDQYSFMHKIYHGHPPNRPSQISLLAEGRTCYSGLYEEVIVPATKKNGSVDSVKKMKLKEIFSRDANHVYYSGQEIYTNDLEKKTQDLF